MGKTKPAKEKKSVSKQNKSSKLKKDMKGEKKELKTEVTPGQLAEIVSKEIHEANKEKEEKEDSDDEKEVEDEEDEQEDEENESDEESKDDDDEDDSDDEEKDKDGDVDMSTESGEEKKRNASARVNAKKMIRESQRSTKPVIKKNTMCRIVRIILQQLGMPRVTVTTTDPVTGKPVETPNQPLRASDEVIELCRNIADQAVFKLCKFIPVHMLIEKRKKLLKAQMQFAYGMFTGDPNNCVKPDEGWDGDETEEEKKEILKKREEKKQLAKENQLKKEKELRKEAKRKEREKEKEKAKKRKEKEKAKAKEKKEKAKAKAKEKKLKAKSKKSKKGKKSKKQS